MIHITAGCKVNLGLHVTGVRDDGYHELDSLFYPLPSPCDHLGVSLSHKPGLTLRCNAPGIDLACNTLTRAYAAFAEAAGSAPGIELELKKGIPLGAGLGGGSSDAAALLLWLNSRLPKPLDQAGLIEIALRVGADTPFFLQRSPCRVRGIGEKLTPLAHDFSGRRLVLVCPDISINTSWAFARYDELCTARKTTAGQKSLTKGRCKANGTSLSGTGFSEAADVWSIWDICNDLEAAVFPQYPQLAAIKADLLRLGADAACMSGSGSSIVGLFGRAEAAHADKAAEALRKGKRRVFLLQL